MPPKKRRSPQKHRPIKSRKSPEFRVWRLPLWWLTLLGVVALCAVGWVLHLDVAVRAKFDGDKWAVPARVYAQPLELYQGLQLAPGALDSELQALGYQFVSEVVRPGQVAKQGQYYDLYVRGFHFGDRQTAARRYSVVLKGGQVASIDGLGADELLLTLEPKEIGSIYPIHGEDRVLLTLSQVPPVLGEALIAVEDKHFSRHWGVSVQGILRAMWVNARAGGWVQGGSTITQQLVKNFYLTHERSLWRKVQEAVMSLLLEWHYSKADILEAYINEVYLGQAGPRAIHGFGLAAQHYFNQPLQSLNTQQLALLVGVVKGASYYNPWRHPQRAYARRNVVLGVMAEQDLLSESERRRLSALPLGIVSQGQRQQGDYPAFLDLVKRQLRRDYRENDLQSEGLRIFTTMSLPVQQHVERVVEDRVFALNQSSPTPLQAAAVITAVGSGEVLAVVGDRRPHFSGFNRALDAKRQVGSLVKPFVYLAALLDSQRYQLSSVLNDNDIKVALDNGIQWAPRNFSGQSHGSVLLYQALAHSYNQATARLGLAVGIERVIDVLQQAGAEGAISDYPSLLLGALALTPFDVSHLYHTLAADGVYTPLRSIRSVVDHNNRPLQRYPLSSSPRFDVAHSHLMHFMLQSVMRVGTGKRAYNILPPSLVVAGKTGTTNDQRDSWFAGYSGDHLGVVWIGNDDNKPTAFTGSTGALSIWSRAFQGLATRSVAQVTPDNVAYYWVDKRSGLRTTASCENGQLVPFIKGTAPEQAGPCHTARDSILGRLKKWFQ